VKIERRQVGPRMSKIVVHGDTVYGRGHSRHDRSPSGEAGTDKSKILQATIWLQDVRTVDEMNAVWDSWVAPGETPARACIEARLQSPALALEIRVIAAR
jgi:hypothetical protein